MQRKKGFTFDVSSLCTTTDGVFRANKLLWDRSDTVWRSSSGETSRFKHIVAGLELDPERVRSFRDPSLDLDVLGPSSDPSYQYDRNDFNRQLQRMYTQFMRPDRFRHYMGTGTALAGWQYLGGRNDTIIDRLLNVGFGVDSIDSVGDGADGDGASSILYGPDPLDPGGQDNWSDRVGYRVEIPRNSDKSTFSFTKEELDTRFEAPFDKTVRSTASKLLDEEREWRQSGVQFYYEVESRIHPLLGQFLQPGQKYITPDEYGRAEPSIYTPDENWLNDPSLTFTFSNGQKKTVNQSAALETIYSVVAGRIGAGVPVVSMGPHNTNGEWRLISIRVLPEQHLFDALMQTQRFINGNDVEIREQEAIALMMARMQSFQNCIQKLAQVGFLHLGVSAVNMFQGTVWKPGKGGEGAIPAQGPQFNGAGQTYVRDFRPRNVTLVRLPEDACSAIMSTILLLDLYGRDTDRELTFLNGVAEILVGQITGIIVARTTNVHMNSFYALMSKAWIFYYEDARKYSGDLQPPAIIQAPVPPPPPPPPPPPSLQPPSISPTNIPPPPIKSDLRRQDAPRLPLPPVFEEGVKLDTTPRDAKSSSKRVNTQNNPGLFEQLLTAGTSKLRKVSTQLSKPEKQQNQSSLSKRISQMMGPQRETSSESSVETSDDSFRDNDVDNDIPLPPSRKPVPVAPATPVTPATPATPSAPAAPPAPRKQTAQERRKEELAQQEVVKRLTDSILNRRRKVDDSGESSDSESGTDSAFSKLFSASTFETYAGKEFDYEIDRMQSLFEADSNSTWKPPRDSVVLAVRVTHRLYELCRNVVFKTAMRQKQELGVASIDPKLNVENATLLLPATVRNFCGPLPQNGETKTSLELAAMLLSKLAK